MQRKLNALLGCLLAVITHDEAPAAQFHDDSESLTLDSGASRRSTTPEGYLRIAGVPIARTGEMLYAPGELPIPPGSDGFIRITRDAATLFSDETIASFEGRAICVGHPPGYNLTPETWREHANGVMLNVRRGDRASETHDCLVADLILMTPDAIKFVQTNDAEVSAGYKALYEPLGPGRGRQNKIVGNHLALVKRGRCGARCAIGDHAAPNLEEEPPMPAAARPAARRPAEPFARRPSALAVFLQKLRDSFDSSIEDALNTENSEVPVDNTDPPGGGVPGMGGDTHIHIHPAGEGGGAADTPPAGGAPGGAAPPATIEDRVAALEDGLSQILAILQGGGGAETPPADADAPPNGAETPPADDGEGGDEPPAPKKDEEKPTGDSAALANDWQNLLAAAELVMPGMQFPTFDAKAKRTSTVEAMCALRTRALQSAYVTKDGHSLINSVHGVTADAAIDFDKMDCAARKTLFNAVAGARTEMNRQATKGGGGMRSAVTADSNRREIPLPTADGAFRSGWVPGTSPRNAAQYNEMMKHHYAKPGNANKVH